jgi:predicted phage-related endonuclease
MSGLTEAQLEFRKGKMTGSMVGAACGMNPWRSEFVAALEFLGEPIPENPRLAKLGKAGSKTEHMVADWFTEETGIKLIKPEEFGIYFQDRRIVDGTILHDSYDWIATTPDRIAIMPDGSLIPVEIKCPVHTTWHHWRDPEKDPTGIPLYHLAQPHWHMFVTGLMPYCMVIGYIDYELLIYKIPWTQTFFDTIMMKVRTFVEGLWAGEMPDVDGSSIARDWLDRHFPRKTKVIRDVEGPDKRLLHRAYSIDAEIKAMTTDLNRKKNQLVKIIGEDKGVQADGVVCTINKAKRVTLKQIGGNK